MSNDNINKINKKHITLLEIEENVEKILLSLQRLKRANGCVKKT